MEKAEWEVPEYEGDDPVPLNQFQKAAITALYKYWKRSPLLTLGQIIQEITLDREGWYNWDEMEWVQYIQEDMNAQDELMRLYNTNE